MGVGSTEGRMLNVVGEESKENYERERTRKSDRRLDNSGTRINTEYIFLSSET
jgi:hypothetical protein